MRVRVPGSASSAQGGEVCEPACWVAGLGIFVRARLWGVPVGCTSTMVGFWVSDRGLVPVNSGIDKFAGVHTSYIHPCVYMGDGCAGVQVNMPGNFHTFLCITIWEGHLFLHSQGVGCTWYTCVSL